MPGRRNLARERAAHQLSSPAHQAALYRLLHTQLPHAELVLIGQKSVLAYLHRLGIRRLNGQQLTWRIVNRWRPLGCPILRGNRSQRRSSVAVTTSHALTAWLLTRFNSSDCFTVVAHSQACDHAVSFPTSQAKAA